MFDDMLDLFQDKLMTILFTCSTVLCSCALGITRLSSHPFTALASVGYWYQRRQTVRLP